MHCGIAVGLYAWGTIKAERSHSPAVHVGLLLALCVRIESDASGTDHVSHMQTSLSLVGFL